jgi:radical SAM superfamily enzyme YgiQ (UPF0313 family)
MDVVLDHICSTQKDYGVEEIQIVDDNFSHHNGKRIEAFCDGLMKRQMKLRWKCQVRADQLREEVISLMGRSGCFEVDIGVESGNECIQRAIGKNLDLAKVRVAVKGLKEAGIVCKAFFILGFPQEKWPELQDSINFAVVLKSLGLKDVAFFPAMPFPGTALADYARSTLGAKITQGAVMDDHNRFMGSYALRRLRKYAAMPEVSLNLMLSSRELRMLCGFAYTCFEKSQPVNGLEDSFRMFAAEQEAMSYGS